MLWVYVLAGTAGFVMLVPEVVRALDGQPSDLVGGTIGFGFTTFAICGLALQQFDMGILSELGGSLALGGAVSAIHPEILRALRGGSPAALPASPASDDE